MRIVGPLPSYTAALTFGPLPNNNRHLSPVTIRLSLRLFEDFSSVTIGKTVSYDLQHIKMRVVLRRSVNGTNNSSFQNYPHPDDHPLTQTTDTPAWVQSIYYVMKQLLMNGITHFIQLIIKRFNSFGLHVLADDSVVVILHRMPFPRFLKVSSSDNISCLMATWDR